MTWTVARSRSTVVDLRDASTASLNATVGVVTQDAHLFHDTLRANLVFAKPDATDQQIANALASAQIAELVASLPSVFRPSWGARLSTLGRREAARGAGPTAAESAAPRRFG